MRQLITQFPIWVLLALGPLSLGTRDVAYGDVLFLATGGRVEAELLNPDESPRRTYELELSSGGRLTLTQRQVNRVVLKSEMQRRYEAMLPRIADTAEGHWDMAERCRKAGLGEARETHLHQVLIHAPDHEDARRALGYSRIDGRWIRQEDWMATQGDVRYRGGWRLPQEIAITELAEEREAREVEWRKKIRMWRKWVTDGQDRRLEGEHELRALRDPAAAVVLADMLGGERELPGLKLLYLEVLGEIGEPVAANALIKHSLYDADKRIREACLDQVERLRPVSALNVYVNALDHDQNFMVHRAAKALARLGDNGATIPLIDALITEHKQIRGGGVLQPMFSNQGGGLNVGGKPKVEKIKVRNDPVLHALSVIHSGVNFGFDQRSWKKWYVSTQTTSAVNLRRSE